MILVKKGKDITIMNEAICRICDAVYHIKPNSAGLLCTHCDSDKVEDTGKEIKYIDSTPVANTVQKIKEPKCTHCGDELYSAKESGLCHSCESKRCPRCEGFNLKFDSVCVGGQSTGMSCDWKCTHSCSSCGYENSWISAD